MSNDDVLDQAQRFFEIAKRTQRPPDGLHSFLFNAMAADPQNRLDEINISFQIFLRFGQNKIYGRLSSILTEDKITDLWLHLNGYPVVKSTIVGDNLMLLSQFIHEFRHAIDEVKKLAKR